MTYRTLNLDAMLRCFLSRLLSVAAFMALCTSVSLAQTNLNRISNVSRSDGKGYVIRYHFTAAVDSFDLFQPAPDLIQMVLYKDSIDTTGIRMPGENDLLKEIRLYDLGYGYGVDIYLSEGSYFKTQSYMDQNGKHLLLALTESSKGTVEKYSQQFFARNWYEEIIPEEDEEPVTVAAPVQNSQYNMIKDKLRFDKIVIDAGHGGHDPGNLGYNRKAKEKDVVLSIAKKLGNYVEELIPGVEVIYTRDSDTFVDLEERGRIANRAEADLFVSIHADAWTSSSVRGSSVFFLGLHRSQKSFEVMKEENQVYHQNELVEDLTEEDLIIYELANSGKIATSERIAYMVEDQLKNRAQRKSRGVKQMGLVVLYQSTMPGILVETGFLTNPAEQRYLTSDYGQDLIASAIYRAIKAYKIQYEESQAQTFNTSSN